MKRLVLFSALAAVPMLLPLAAPAAAQQYARYPWCSQYSSPSEAHSCAFTSYAQCMATVSGIGGFCYRNPYLAYGQARTSRGY